MRYRDVRQRTINTTPESLDLQATLRAMRTHGIDTAVMEVSSHGLDLGRVDHCHFRVAAFTNLTQDHLDYHGDMETYFKAKARLFSTYLRPGRAGVINYNDPYGRRLLAATEGGIGYGIGDSSLVTHEVGDKPMVQGRILSLTGQGMQIETSYKGKSWVVESPLIGAFNAMNLLAAQAVGLQLGLNCKDMRALKDFPGVPGRLERVINDQGLDIFVDYAHTPDALENVQHTLKSLDFKRLITVFGCGGERDRAKRPLMARAVARYADVAVLTSDNPRSEKPEAIMDDARPGLARAAVVFEHPDRQTAITMAVAEMKRGDVLLIAGKGHEDYQQIAGTTIHFSDKEAVLRAISDREAALRAISDKDAALRAIGETR
jgi:UDP-N-acetylmuramoyl-L-alanyl-D-glutamate--2,6-diaminopimelate ligase